MKMLKLIVVGMLLNLSLLNAAEAGSKGLKIGDSVAGEEGSAFGMG